MAGTLSGSMSNIIARSRESKWAAVDMIEAISLVRLKSQALVPCIKMVPVTALQNGQVLAEDITAACDIPAVRTSIKDGYAIISSDGVGDRTMIGSSTAGSPFQGLLQKGQCVRVSTGATIPEGADAVLQVENTKITEHDNVEERVVEMQKAVLPGTDIRLPGSDMRNGDTLLRRGCVIGSAEIGVLAGSGRRAVAVYRKTRICVMSTGNELVECNVEDVPLGYTRDTNRPQLLALFQAQGFKAIDAGIAPDRKESLRDALLVAFRFATIVVTSGGVSMGEKDHMKEVLQEMGFTINFGRVKMKPGLPSTFATGLFEGEGRMVFALPGNPASSWVSAHLFVVPAARTLGGHTKTEQTVLRARLGEPVRLDARPEYRRAWLQYKTDLPDFDGLPTAMFTGNQISSRVVSLSGANVLVVLPPATEELKFLPVGEIVDALVVGPI